MGRRRNNKCDVCRTRKIKCDETYPECTPCRETMRDCPGPIIGSIFVARASSRFVVDHPRRNIFRSTRTATSLQTQGSTLAAFQSPSNPVTEYERSDGRASSALTYPTLSLTGYIMQTFDSHPIGIIDNATASVIEMYLFCFPRKISTMGPTSTWFPQALRDPVLLEVTLFVAASYHGLMSGSKSSLMVASWHKGKLLRLINNRLEDKVLSVTDPMICAVALLAGSEGINGTSNHWRIHMTGLKRMIIMRGGIQTLGPQNSATTILASAYSYGACRLQSKPDVFFSGEEFQEVVECLNRKLVDETPGSVLNGVDRCITLKLIRDGMKQCSKIALSLFNCFEELRHVSLVIAASHYTSWTDARLKFLDGKLTVIEYQLAVLMERSILNREGYMEQCLCMAGFIFVSTYLRDRGKGAAVHLDLLERLEICAKRSRPELEWVWPWGTLGDELLLWVLFIGVTSSVVSDERREWFLRRLLKVSERMGLQTWHLLVSNLKKSLWSTRLDGMAEILRVEFETYLHGGHEDLT